jgi:hypothetical protein
VKILARLSPAFLLTFALGGCTVIGGDPVPGWPALEIIEHHVPHAEMRERCGRYVSLLMSPEACAEFDFANRSCHVWFSADFPPPRYVVQHEREHCLGYEHAGEQGMREILSSYLATRDALASQGASSAPRTKLGQSAAQ